MPSPLKCGLHLAAVAVLSVVGLVATSLVPVASVSAAPAPTTTLAVQYLQSDLLGTVRLASSSTGVVVSTTRFDEFGARTADTGIADSSIGYAGNLTDPTGLIALHDAGDWLAGAADTFAAVVAAGKIGHAAAQRIITTGIQAILRATILKSANTTRIAADDLAGIVYQRTELLDGKPYIGEAKSGSRFITRQAEHARANPDADFEFEIIGRAEPGAELNRLEEYFIRQGGGPTNLSHPDGGLANWRHQMSDPRYSHDGGDPW
jgi:hypothetical protein